LAVFEFGTGEISVAGDGGLELGSVEGDELTAAQAFVFLELNEQAPVETDPR
jgi:hypothetical protein